MIDTSLATQFLGEVIGTAILIILGAGVVAGVSLKKIQSREWRLGRYYFSLGAGCYNGCVCLRVYEYGPS